MIDRLIYLPGEGHPDKAGFHSHYCSELREDSDKIHVVIEPLWFYSKELDLWFCIPKGFQCDQSSVPRIPIVYWFWGNRSHREGVLHDYVFRIDSEHNLSLPQCNALFREAMISRGKSPFVYQPMYWGVCLSSAPFYHRRYVNDTL